MKLRALFFGLILFVLLGCGLTTQDEQGETTGINQGSIAPDFELQSIIGRKETLRQYRGQPVLVNIFATWCGPCMAEMPAIEAVYQRYRPKGLAILAVDQDESLDAVSAMRDDLNLSFPLLLDPGSRIGQRYGARSIPRTFYIDANGVIRRVIVGDQPESLIDESVAELFQYAYVLPTVPPGSADGKAPAGTGMNGCVNIKSALVRVGPGSSHKVVSQMTYQTCAPFDARSEDGSWLRLTSPGSGGERLWVSAEFITLDGQAFNLPVGE